MSRIFFDTNLFIYLLEDEGERGAQVSRLLQRIILRRDELMTSVLTLGEILVKPLAAGDLAWADRCERMLSTAGMSVLPFDKSTARIYAQIRRDKTLKPPDAIQLACAGSARCDLFVTNDNRLRQKIVPGIQFIASLDQSFV